MRSRSAKSKKIIEADNLSDRLGKEILEAEEQIKKGKVVPWSKVKRHHQ